METFNREDDRESHYLIKRSDELQLSASENGLILEKVMFKVAI